MRFFLNYGKFSVDGAIIVYGQNANSSYNQNVIEELCLYNTESEMRIVQL